MNPRPLYAIAVLGLMLPFASAQPFPLLEPAFQAANSLLDQEDEGLAYCNSYDSPNSVPGQETLERNGMMLPFQELGEQVCNAVQAISAMSIIKADGRQYGQLTIRFILPHVISHERFPLPRDADPRDERVADYAENLNEDVEGLASDPLGTTRWIPLMVNPNNVTNPVHVPCLAQDLVSPDVPQPCGEIRACSKDCSTTVTETDAGGFELNDRFTVDLSRLTSVENIYRIDIEGYDRLLNKVYETVLNNVATAGNTAVEYLDDVEGKIFQIRSYLTPADAAANRAVESVAIVQEAVAGVKIIDFDQLPDGEPASPRSGEMEQEAANECREGFQDGWVLLTVGNGCVTTGVIANGHTVAPWETWAPDLCHCDPGNLPFYRNPRVEFGGARSSMMVHLPPIAGMGHGTDVTIYANTPTLRIVGTSNVRVSPIWEYSADVDMNCASAFQGWAASGCAAHGAQLSSWTSATRTRANQQASVYSEFMHYTSAYNVEWCPPELVRVPLWYVIARMSMCVAPLESDSEVQESHAIMGANSNIVMKAKDLSVDPTDGIALYSDFMASLHGTTQYNLPYVRDGNVQFLGFAIQALD